MPLVCLRIDYRPGVSECILLEFVEGVNYKAFSQLLHNVLKQQPKRASFIDKNILGGLLQLCLSDRERELVRYAAVKSAGLSSTQAQKQLGFQNMTDRVAKVQNAFQHAMFIRKSIDGLASTKDKAFLKSIGITIDDSSSSEYSEDENNKYQLLKIKDISEFEALTAECHAAETRKAQQQLTETGNCEGYNDDNGKINDDDNEEYCGVYMKKKLMKLKNGMWNVVSLGVCKYCGESQY